MYPSIKLSTIKKEVRFFAKTLILSTNKTINLCLELIRFGMRSTLISFYGEYYDYHGGKKKEQGLVIGGYESHFLSNLFESFLFETAKAILNPTTYYGIYWYGGLVVFNGKEIVKEIKYWLNDFQQTVNRALGNQHLQFAAEIWTTDANPPPPSFERGQGWSRDERRIPFPIHEN